LGDKEMIMKIKQLGILSATLLSGAAQADGPGGRPG
jgi:hypothetical protein